ncbi:MAG: glutamate racemase [Paraglaciecola sp.]|jgi:glutamate racemase
MHQPIGIFDSGYGGLTILREITAELPEYDFLYLGDNARAPYGTRSFDTIYQYTLECVQFLFSQGCELVILACNTASAKALRSIQQLDLPCIAPEKRVLGVIRPTTKVIGQFTKTNHIGILGTNGTVDSKSYLIELEKFSPEITAYQQACPMWVPLVETGEHSSKGAYYFAEKDLTKLLKQSPKIDTLLLACTHYPLLLPIIRSVLPPHIQVVEQGKIVAKSLKDYLERHPKMDQRCSKNRARRFLTSGDAGDFEARGAVFFGEKVVAEKVNLVKG